MGNSLDFRSQCAILADDVRNLVGVTCESVTSGGVKWLETTGNKNTVFPSAL